MTFEAELLYYTARIIYDIMYDIVSVSDMLGTESVPVSRLLHCHCCIKSV